MKRFGQEISNRKKLFKHIKTALFVGIILNIINQQDLIWGFYWHELQISKMVMTFFVPFAVSVYSAATSIPSIDQGRKGLSK
ncbi:MAG: hypothetical protein K0B37_12610 [Bacteroidales bacterium]|nr:hypothetical protein [Bacteroidales bacterium]